MPQAHHIIILLLNTFASFSITDFSTCLSSLRRPSSSNSYDLRAILRFYRIKGSNIIYIAIICVCYERNLKFVSITISRYSNHNFKNLFSIFFILFILYFEICYEENFEFTSVLLFSNDHNLTLKIYFQFFLFFLFYI